MRPNHLYTAPMHTVNNIQKERKTTVNNSHALLNVQGRVLVSKENCCYTFSKALWTHFIFFFQESELLLLCCVRYSQHIAQGHVLKAFRLSNIIVWKKGQCLL